MKKGKPFLEILASTLHEDYRFPIFEVFAFLFALGTFALSGAFKVSPASNEVMIYMLISNLMGMPLFIFILLIFKNIAYGLGSDLEKGTIQTLLSYPIKRRSLLTAKLLSAIGVAMLLFCGIQVIALVILAPSMVLPHFDILLLSYIANFGFVLFLTAIILLVTLILKRGGLSLIVGIIAYFALGITASLMLYIATVTNSTLPLQIVAFLNPSYALSAHYGVLQLALANIIWAPAFSEVSVYIIGNYVIIGLFFFLAYYYFSRRLNV